MKIKLFHIGLFCIISTAFTLDTLPKKFSNLLERAQLTYENNSELTVTKIIANKSMNYDYALKYPNLNFEVRYIIRPMKDYPSPKLNNLYLSLLKAMILEVSTKQLSFGFLDSSSLDKEFNADWGASAFVELKKEFAQSYKYCMIVAIHKNYIGDFYCLYLSDKKEGYEKLIIPPFHILKFK